MNEPFFPTAVFVVCTMDGANAAPLTEATAPTELVVLMNSRRVNIGNRNFIGCPQGYSATCERGWHRFRVRNAARNQNPGSRFEEVTGRVYAPANRFQSDIKGEVVWEFVALAALYTMHTPSQSD